MSLLAAVLAFLVPLALTPRLLFYYDITPKIALLILAAVLALAACAAELGSWAAFARTRWGRWYLGAALASICAVVIAALRSPDWTLAWYGSNWRRMGALDEIAIVLAALSTAQIATRSQRNLVWLLRAVSAAGLIAALYGIAQYLGWDPILNRAEYAVGEGIFQIVRPPGTLGHSDYFGIFLVWPAFAGFALNEFERSKAWRWLALSSSICASVAILLSGSRGALVGLLCGVAVRLALKRPASRKIAAVSLICGAAFAVFYISPAGERLRARVHWIEEDPVGGARLLLWRDTLALAAQRPWTGVGPDVFSAEFPKVESVDLARAYPDFYHESPHNLLLDVLTASGAIGLLALALLLFTGIAGGVHARKERALPVHAFLPALAAGLIAMQFAVWTAPTAFFLYLGAGILAGADRAETPEPRIALAWRRVVLVAGLAASVLLGVCGYRLVRQDAFLATVQRRLDSGDLRGAASVYQAALKSPETGVTADLYLSRRWSQVAMHSAAAMPKIYYSQIAAGAATLATHRPEQLANAWYNLSVLAAARSDAAGTEYALRQSLAAAPAWYKPHWILARLLSEEGRAPEAAAEAARAMQLNNGKDPEVSSTLAQLVRSAAPER